MRVHVAIALLMFGCAASYARDIRGSLIDETGQPALFVNVVLMNDSTFIDGKVTDDAGTFVFENADSLANKVKITMTGYEEMVLPIPADGNYNTITLKPSAVMLGEVVVKGDLPSTRIKGNAIVTRVENSVLATTGSANDVLKNIPMVTGSNGNFSVFGRGDAIIYINGRLVRSSDEIGQLASGDIKEIQVINNPGARYGANVNSVIRIVTKKPVG
ncbi:MAG: carboxypeptidase-like regulatory domain-containing protein, partial [Duncaniella sp.]|nr:carboxypeptidase-like regulatory domain-containing protein [Duncaniella sp.]